MKFRIISAMLSCTAVFAGLIPGLPNSPAEVKAADAYTAEITFGKSTELSNISGFYADGETYSDFEGTKGVFLSSSAGSDISLKLDVDDKFIKNNDDGTAVYVTVEYYDVGNGCFQLIYDSTFSSYERQYQYSEIVYLENTNMWKTHTFELTDAYFGNRIDGMYDIKVAVRSSRISQSCGNVTIHSVRIEKQKEKKSVQVLEGSTEYIGNIFGNGEEKVFDLRIKNYSEQQEKRTLRVSVTDDTAVEYWAEDIPVELAAKEERTEKITAEINRYGTYYLVTDVISDEGATEFTKRIPFSFVNTRDDGKLNYDLGYCAHFDWNRDPFAGCEVIKKSNAGAFRCEFTWTGCDLSWSEPLNFSPNTALSNMSQATKESGIKWLVVLGLADTGKYGFTSQSDFPMTEQQMMAWETYVGNVVNYMGDTAYGYEVWNEPNHSSFGTGGPAAYADFAKVACRKIKELAPDKKVAVMSFTGVQNSELFEWYKQALDAGAADYADAISVHPYCQGLPGETVLGAVQRFKDTAREMTGKDFEMWHTEMGWPVGEFNQTEEVQAQYITRFYMQESANGILDQFSIYDLTEDGALDAIHNREHNFAVLASHSSEIADYPYAAKKSYVAITNMNNLLVGAEGVEYQELDGNVNICRFERAEREETGKQVISLWSVNEAQSMALDLGVTDVTYSDMYGNQKKLHSDSGIYNFVTSKSPIYVMGDFTGFEVTDSTISFSEISINAAAGDRKTITITNNTGKKLTPKIVAADNISPIINDTLIDKSGSFALSVPETIGVETAIDVELYDGTDLVCNAQLPLYIMEKLSSTVECNLKSTENLNDWTAHIEIENLSELTAANGKLTIISPQKFAAAADAKPIGVIPAGKTAEIDLQLPEIKEKSMEPFEYEIELDSGYKQTFSQMINFTVSAYAQTKPKIDGVKEEGEWNLDTELIANNINNAVMLNSNVYGGLKDLWFSAILEWDEEYVYLCIDANDDVYSVDATGSNIWQNDCPQIGISYKRMGEQSAGESLFTEIGLCDTKTGGPTVWCYSREKRSSGTGDISDKCELAVKRTDTNTVYEAKIPWTEIIPDGCSIEETDTIQFSMLLNDNDGNGRKGWMEYASGIGQSKDVNQFITLRLIK